MSNTTVLLLLAVAFSVIYLAGQPLGTIGRAAHSIAEAGLNDSQDIASTDKQLSMSRATWHPDGAGSPVKYTALN